MVIGVPELRNASYHSLQPVSEVRMGVSDLLPAGVSGPTREPAGPRVPSVGARCRSAWRQGSRARRRNRHGIRRLDSPEAKGNAGAHLLTTRNALGMVALRDGSWTRGTVRKTAGSVRLHEVGAGMPRFQSRS